MTCLDKNLKKKEIIMKYILRNSFNLKLNGLYYQFFENFYIKKKRLEFIFSYNLPRKLKFSKFLKAFIEDSLISAILTLVFYFIIVFFIVIFININILSQDPSQDVKKLYSPVDSTEYSDLILLNYKLIQVLEKTKGKYFLCYRSLLYILKFNPKIYDKNFLDLCFFDPDTSIHNILSNIIYMLSNSELDFALSKISHHSSGISFEFNSLFGYYKISYKKVNVFLYLFIKSPESYQEFASATRFGIMYLQLNEVTKRLCSLEKKQPIDFVKNIPIYFVDEMAYKVNIANSYVWIPTDPLNSLLYFYPNYWYLPLNNNKLK